MNLQDLFNDNSSHKFVKHSQGTRAKMSAAQKDRFFSDEHRTKISIAASSRIYSEETKQKISASLKGNVPVNKQAIFTPDGIFESCKEAADYYGINSATIFYRMKKFPEQYFRLECQK